MNDDGNCYYYYDYDCIVCMIVCSVRLKGGFRFNSFVISGVQSFQCSGAACGTQGPSEGNFLRQSLVLLLIFTNRTIREDSR